MEKIKNYADNRQLGFCIHCGGANETRDHAPSKILLDDPLPLGWQPLPCCESCNRKYSSHEEYLAIFIECVICGTTDPDQIQREKVASALRNHPELRKKIESLRNVIILPNGGNRIEWEPPEEDRVRAVIMKLARCHAAYELNIPQISEPNNSLIIPLSLLTQQQRADFERSPHGGMWPEIGSRAMQRSMEEGEEHHKNGWVVVQKGRYRYMAVEVDTITIRGVLSEYLAYEVIWD